MPSTPGGSTALEALFSFSIALFYFLGDYCCLLALIASDGSVVWLTIALLEDTYVVMMLASNILCFQSISF